MTNGFHITEDNLSKIKDLSRRNKIDQASILEPDTILVNLGTQDLLSLCDPKPEIKDVLSILIVTLTPSAQELLQKSVPQRGAKILEIARTLAKERQHPEVTEDDIRDAIKQMEGKLQ